MKIVGILMLTVIVLKIIGIVKWSWIMVLLPIWLPIAIELLWVCGCRMLDWMLGDKESVK